MAKALVANTSECVLRGATGDVVVVGGGEWFQTAEKASMTPHANDDEKGIDQHLIYCIFSCTMHISLQAMI